MSEKIVNGLDIERLEKIIRDVGEDPGLGAFQFRTRTKWLDGGNSQTSIASFYGARQENDGRHFTLEADEPPLLLGRDRAPNPVEHLLNALACCLTASMVYHAAARGIRIDECECELRGELDVRGFLGLAPDVRKGYRSIEAHFRVRSDGDVRTLEECARFSPVLDVVSNGTGVRLVIEPLGTTPEARREEEEHAPSP